MQENNIFRRISFFLIALGVTMGAFGAHALKDQITTERLEVFKTGTQYLISMSIVLLITSLFDEVSKKLKICLLTGILVFSISLYLLVLLDIPKFGMITPIGGLLIIFSLLTLSVSSRKSL